MRLLMISGDRSLAAGKRGAFYNTLEEFHKYWERIDVICPAAPPAGGAAGQPLSFFGNVFIHSSPWPLWLQPFWILKKGRNLYLERKFDLMTVHEYPPFYNGLGARLLWRKIRVPYVLEIMHIPGYPRSAGFKESFYKNLIRRFVRYDAAKARAVRIINQKQTREFLLTAGVPTDKLVYIHANYIDPDIFKPMTDVEKRYDLVYAARLEKNKGIFNLIEAVKIAKKEKPDIKLLIIGGGPEKNNLESRIKNLELGNNVFFSGWLETQHDVARAYNSARIFINPSLNEGGPRVVLEAMACGLPVITTPVGIMLDVIRDGESGLFTDWGPAQMAGKILWLINNKELQTKFAMAGLELVKDFEKKAAIRNYAENLKRLI